MYVVSHTQPLSQAAPGSAICFLFVFWGKDQEPAHFGFVYFLAFSWIQFPLRLACGGGPQLSVLGPLPSDLYFRLFPLRQETQWRHFPA